MTQSTVQCSECDRIVELLREDNNTLSLVCDCGESRSIKVIAKLPTGWEA